VHRALPLAVFPHPSGSLCWIAIRLACGFAASCAARHASPRTYTGFVDHAHPAAAEFIGDAAMRNGWSDHERAANSGLLW